MLELGNTGLLVDHFKALIVSEIKNERTKQRFKHPDIHLPCPGEIIIDSDGQKWKFYTVYVPKKDDVFFWCGYDGKCYLLMATERPMMDYIFYNQIFVKHD